VRCRTSLLAFARIWWCVAPYPCRGAEPCCLPARRRSAGIRAGTMRSGTSVGGGPHWCQLSRGGNHQPPQRPQIDRWPDYRWFPADDNSHWRHGRIVSVSSCRGRDGVRPRQPARRGHCPPQDQSARARRRVAGRTRGEGAAARQRDGEWGRRVDARSIMPAGSRGGKANAGRCCAGCELGMAETLDPNVRSRYDDHAHPKEGEGASDRGRCSLGMPCDSDLGLHFGAMR
jgi:hypothetical protein